MGKRSIISNNLSVFSTSKFGWLQQGRDAFDKVAFGILYAMVHGNTFSRKFLLLNMIVEFLQLLSFCFRDLFPWEKKITYLGFSLSFTRLPESVFSYFAFTVIYWLALGFVWLALLNSILVSYGFHNESFRFIWPIRTLRWFVSVLISALYIPVLVVMLMSLAPASGKSILAAFEGAEIQVFGTQNVAKVVVSIITILCFMPFAFVSSAIYYEHDPTVKSTYGRVHGRFDLILVLLKTVWTFLFEFAPNVPWLLTIALVLGSAIALSYSYIYMPLYNQRLNQLRTGFFGVISWASFVLVVCMIINNDHNQASTWLFVAGIIPSFALAWYLYGYRLERLRKTCYAMTNSNDLASADIAMSDKDVTPMRPTVSWVPDRHIVDQSVVHAAAKQLMFSTDVELLTRFVLQTPVTETSIDQAETIFRAGLRRFKGSTLVMMSYINFLMVYKKDRHRGYALLEKLRRAHPMFDVRFFIYRQDKERERQVQLEGMGSGKFEDFVGYIEFQKLSSQARNGHLECLQLVRKFWQILLEGSIDVSKLATYAGKISAAEEKTDKIFRTLLGLYPNSPRILRDFAQFVDDIFQEEEVVRMLVERADMLEETSSKSRSKTPEGGNTHRDKDSDVDSDTLFGGKDSASSIDWASSANSLKSGSSFHKRKLMYLKDEDKTGCSALKALSWTMIITTIVAVTLLIAMSVSVSAGLQTYSHKLDKVKCAAVLNQMSTDITTKVILLRNVALLNQTIYASYVTQQSALNIRRSTIIKNVMQAIVWDEKDLKPFYSDRYKNISGILNTTIDIGAKLLDYKDYNKSSKADKENQLDKVYYGSNFDVLLNSMPLTTKKDNPDDIVKWGLWPASRLFADSVEAYSKQTFAQLATFTNDANFNFIVSNGPSGLSDGLNTLLQTQGKSAQDALEYLMVNAYIIYGAIVACLIVIGIFVFRPVVNRVVGQKTRTLNLFLLVPLPVVRKMVTKASKKAKVHSARLASEANGSHNALDIESRPLNDVAVVEDVDDEDGDDDNNNNNNTDNVIINTEPKEDENNGNENEREALLEHEGERQAEEEQDNVMIMDGHVVDLDEDHPLLTHVMTNNSGFVYSSDYQDLDYEKKMNLERKMKEAQSARKNSFLSLHIKYVVGLLFIVALFSSNLILTRRTIDTFMPAYETVYAASERSRAIMKVVDDVVMLTCVPLRVNQTKTKLKQSLEDLYAAEHAVEWMMHSLDSDVAMRETYSEGCTRVDKSLCRKPDDRFYLYTSQGLQYTLNEFARAAQWVYDYPDINNILKVANTFQWNLVYNLGENELGEAADVLLIQISKYWDKKLDNAKGVVGGIVSMLIVVVILEYFIFFRRIIIKLDNESQNTLAMLQMIPKAELKGVNDLMDNLAATNSNAPETRV